MHILMKIELLLLCASVSFFVCSFCYILVLIIAKVDDTTVKVLVKPLVKVGLICGFGAAIMSFPAIVAQLFFL